MFRPLAFLCRHCAKEYGVFNSEELAKHINLPMPPELRMRSIQQQTIQGRVLLMKGENSERDRTCAHVLLKEFEAQKFGSFELNAITTWPIIAKSK